MSRVWCFHPAAFVSGSACVHSACNIKPAHSFCWRASCNRQHDSQAAFVAPALVGTSTLLQVFFFWQAVIVLWRPLEWRALKSFSVVLHRIKTFLVSVGENVCFLSLFMIKTFKRLQCAFSWFWNMCLLWHTVYEETPTMEHKLRQLFLCLWLTALQPTLPNLLCFMLSSPINDIFLKRKDDALYVLCILKHHLVPQNGSSLHAAPKSAS